MAAARLEEIRGRQTPTLSTIIALAQLQYGRTLEKMGRRDESRQAYAACLETWKDADAGLPVVKAARAEAAAIGVK